MESLPEDLRWASRPTRCASSARPGRSGPRGLRKGAPCRGIQRCSQRPARGVFVSAQTCDSLPLACSFVFSESVEVGLGRGLPFFFFVRHVFARKEVEGRLDREFLVVSVLVVSPDHIGGN